MLPRVYRSSSPGATDSADLVRQSGLTKIIAYVSVLRVPTDPPLPDWVVPRRQALGRHIARQRRARGLVIDDVAEASGLNRKTVMAVEHAQGAPSLTTLLLIADALGVTVSELLDDGPAAATGTAGDGATCP